jgi:hypothetical protein
VTIRHPTLDDVPEILAVIHASDIAAVGEPDSTADEIVEILAAPNHDPARDSWLALDGDGRIVGWAYIWNPNRADRENFDAYVHPEHGRAAQPYLLNLVLERIAERARDAGRESLIARGGVIASETEYVAALTAAGFRFIKRYARMRRPLTGEERPPVVPDGVTVRPLDHENETELRTFHDVLDQAFRDTPDYQASDFAVFQARLASLPTIDWDEWFVAEVDGEIAAVLQSSGDESDEGLGQEPRRRQGVPRSRTGPAAAGDGVRDVRGQGPGGGRAGRRPDQPHRGIPALRERGPARGLRVRCVRTDGRGLVLWSRCGWGGPGAPRRSRPERRPCGRPPRSRTGTTRSAGRPRTRRRHRPRT